MLVLAFFTAALATAAYLAFYKLAESKRWLKWFIAYLWLRWFRPQPHLFPFGLNSKDLGELGITVLPKAWEQESPRPLSTHLHALDGISVSGVNGKGEVLNVRFGRRHGRQAEVSLYLRLEDGQEYQLPHQPDAIVYNTDGKSFSAVGLSLELMEPLKRWRINYNGYLRKIGNWHKNDDEEDLVLVKINLIWCPLMNYVAFPEDYNPSYIAEYLSQQNNICPFNFADSLPFRHYEQFGLVRGNVTVEGQEMHEILVRGLKQRLHGFEDYEKIQHRLSIQGVLNNGCSFHIFLENIKDGLEKFVYGYVCPPCNMSVYHLRKSFLDVTPICDDDFHPHTFNVDFVAGPFEYRLAIVTQRDVNSQRFSGENRELCTDLYKCQVTLNDKPGQGILQFTHKNRGQEAQPSPSIKFCSVPLLNQSDLQHTPKLVVAFTEHECTSGQIVGGKGASLSLMTHLGKSNTQFCVPAGVCLTKTAFQQHLKENSKLAKQIDQLQKTSNCIGTPPELQEECKKLVEAVEQTTLSQTLTEQLQTVLEAACGEDFLTNHYAVRSSAIGEDGDDLSAAGQNETFLGVRGLDQICTSVVRCWASQFAFRSVEYQRQNGQLLNKGMAVVVQEMVEAEVAGVLFSRDPVTGSPDKIFITCNYGLGETVVSAAVDPDTVVLKRSWNDQLSLHSVQVGSKDIQLSMASDGGTEEVKVDPSASSQCSLPDDMALKLGELAICLEKHFGSSRDIEWALNKERIFLLQSRPVTTDNPTSDYEIMHEFDSGSKTDHEVYTTANAAEVMPGSTTPITISTFFRAQIPIFNKYFLWKVKRYRYDPTPNDQTMDLFYGNVVFNQIMQKAWTLSREKNSTTKAIEIGIYGRILDDDDVTEMAIDRYSHPPGPLHAINISFIFLKGMTIGSWMLKRARKRFENYPVPTEGMKNPQDCLDILARSFVDVAPMMHVHFAVTMASTMWNLLTLNILSTSKDKDFSTDQYADFALLVGSFNGAESGNVPASLEELAKLIAEDMDAQKFSKMPTEEALSWLHNGTTRSHKQFLEFLNRHGHRGLKEFDMSCNTWAIDQSQVVKALQGMLHAGPPKIKPKQQDSTLIDQIKTPLTPFRKFLLRLVMKGCRMGVCNREKAKSMLIKSNDSLRLGYRHLAQLLIRQGYFTDPNLIFFFTQDELQRQLITRSPKVLKRAKQRQRVHKIMDEFKFPEIIEGEPVPINMLSNDIQVVTSGVKVKGLPVSQGTIKALARVITSLKDVHTIQPGEILITRGTDIGWTPYFPLLSGVVTEIGGLVSHGAVIARECGLPCIVGVENATRLFQTGDTVYLNASDGYIIKVEEN